MAKLVPMDRVAGSAGGTTTVMRSSARRMIVWTFTYIEMSWKGSGAGRRDAHPETHELNSRSHEAQAGNTGENDNEAHRVPIELEAHGLGK